MCGRFAKKRPASEYTKVFRAELPLSDWIPRFNLSPGQQSLIVLRTDSDSPPEINHSMGTRLHIGPKNSENTPQSMPGLRADF